MKQKNLDTHEFSIYWHGSSGLAERQGASFIVDDPDLLHRIVRVLRLREGDTFILFDANIHLQAELITVLSKRSIELKIISCKENEILEPAISFFLPILKRDALEQAIYSLVELGTTTIQLMNTQKVQRKWGGQKELDRLHTIMIAAAEQSKQYKISTLYEPKPFVECVERMDAEYCFFFDAAGNELLPVVTSLHAEQVNQIQLMIGPEGDLTMQEKELLTQRGVQFLRLTPTILRAQQAVAVSMGVFRSLFTPRSP